MTTKYASVAIQYLRSEALICRNLLFFQTGSQSFEEILPFGNAQAAAITVSFPEYTGWFS